MPPLDPQGSLLDQRRLPSPSGPENHYGRIEKARVMHKMYALLFFTKKKNKSP